MLNEFDATAKGKATSSLTSVEPSGDVNDVNEPVVDQAAVTTPPVIGGQLKNTLGNIGDMLDSDFTTADGQTIPRKTMVATACVIFTDFTATFIAFAILVNIGKFGEEFLGYDRAQLDKSMLIMSGVDAAFFLLNGCLTDVYGKYYRALHIYSVICLVGTLILPLLTYSWSVFGPSYVISIPIRRIVFYTARVIISLGVTGINTTAPPLAGRLVQMYGKASVQSCFHYIYMAVRSANLLAVTSLAFIQLNISFFSGYLSTLAFKLLSMYCLFYCRKKFHLNTDHRETVATKVTREAAGAIMTKLSMICPCCTNLRSSVQAMEEESMELISQSTIKSISSTRAGVVAVEKTLTKLSTAAGPSGSASVASTTDPATTSTSYGTVDVKASVLSTSVNPSGTGGASVETFSTVEVSVEERTEVLPETASHALYVCCAILLLSCQVPYSILRYQISSSFISQAERMRPTVLGKDIDPALLHRYLPLLGIALAPVFEIYIYPYISKRFITMTMPNRMKIGIVFATLAVLFAAFVETARMTFIHRGQFLDQDVH
ncbi:uncharacterized protein LOC590629 [Strongylocentrotus purpuratus]|uniref:Uncharacterized protein n=1 Tax=Strongylocentrotus purpuratus TaxID=7668 RepID=A0A7M7NYJ9_STRPU|nr:uncharacterized protein LOC590629 [Strongylocentrotus purpuratus]